MAVENITESSSVEGTQGAGEAGGIESKPRPKMGAGTKIGNLGQLKAASPELWEKLLQTMAVEITNKMKRNQENLKKLMREGQRR